MDFKTFIDTAAPTPFGWVITTQNAFNLTSMLAFRNQLLSLSRAVEAVAPSPSDAGRVEITVHSA